MSKPPPFSALRQLAALAWPLAAALLVSLAHAQAQAQTALPPWPKVPVPQEAHRFSVMPMAHINGQLTRTQGYFSTQPPQNLVTWYQKTTRGPWLNRQIGAQTVLSQWSAPFFTTVQIQATGSGSKVLVATAALQKSSTATSPLGAASESLLQSLPGDTRLLQHLSTADPGQLSTYYVLDTPHGPTGTLQAIKTWLGQQGYRLHTQGTDKQGAQMLQFSGERREALVIAAKRPDASSYVLFNDIRFTP
jgi:hypothetical protein